MKDWIMPIGGIAMLIVIIFLVGAGFTGYVKNAVKLFECDFKPSYKAEVIRTIGMILPPIGVIAGYVEIDGCTNEQI